MKVINHSEMTKISRLSALRLDVTQEEKFASQIKDVLTYAEEIINLELPSEVEANRGINVFREDKVKAKDSSAILKVAPKISGNYLAVPKILD